MSQGSSRHLPGRGRMREGASPHPCGGSEPRELRSRGEISAARREGSIARGYREARRLLLPQNGIKGWCIDDALAAPEQALSVQRLGRQSQLGIHIVDPSAEIEGQGAPSFGIREQHGETFPRSGGFSTNPADVRDAVSLFVTLVPCGTRDYQVQRWELVPSRMHISSRLTPEKFDRESSEDPYFRDLCDALGAAFGLCRNAYRLPRSLSTSQSATYAVNHTSRVLMGVFTSELFRRSGLPFLYRVRVPQSAAETDKLVTLAKQLGVAYPASDSQIDMMTVFHENTRQSNAIYDKVLGLTKAVLQRSDESEPLGYHSASMTRPLRVVVDCITTLCLSSFLRSGEFPHRLLAGLDHAI